jgi:hypothetical protein
MNERETISIDEDKKDLFEKLRTKLGNVENKTAFMVAMAYGWKNGSRLELNKRLGWVRTSYLSDTDKALMIAIAGSDPQYQEATVADMNVIYGLAEEYARGGIAHLRELLESPLDFQKQLATEVMERYGEVACEQPIGE